MPGSALYASSKRALDVISVSLSRELGPRGIRVNVGPPCGTETEGNHRVELAGSPQQQVIIDATPLRRFGQPQDIAPTAVFLASDDSVWLTGEHIAVSGGLL
jgi:3-oxoacyl-[acyl-carrier protein] reductase